MLSLVAVLYHFTDNNTLLFLSLGHISPLPLPCSSRYKVSSSISLLTTEQPVSELPLEWRMALSLNKEHRLFSTHSLVWEVGFWDFWCWKRDVSKCGIKIWWVHWDKLMRPWQTTWGTVVSLHIPEQWILARPCLAPLSKLLCHFMEEVNNLEHSFFPPLLHLSFSFSQCILGCEQRDSGISFPGVWGSRANKRQAWGYWGETWGYWGTPAVELLNLLFFIFVTLCFHAYNLPPSLTVPCPSASCRFLIKDNISLNSPTPLSCALPLLLHLLLSCLSFLLPSRVRRPGSLPSACLWNLWAEPRYALCMLKLNAFPSSFISLLPLSFLRFENSCPEHCFPTSRWQAVVLMWVMTAQSV